MVVEKLGAEAKSPKPRRRPIGLAKKESVLETIAQTKPIPTLPQAVPSKPAPGKPKNPWEELGITQSDYENHRKTAEATIGAVMEHLNDELYKHFRRVENAFSAYDAGREIMKGEKCLICDLPGYEVCPICIYARANYKPAHERIKVIKHG